MQVIKIISIALLVSFATLLFVRGKGFDTFLTFESESATTTPALVVTSTTESTHSLSAVPKAPKTNPATIEKKDTGSKRVSTQVNATETSVTSVSVAAKPTESAPKPAQAPVVEAKPIASAVSDGRPVITLVDLEMRIHELVNKERVAQGLSVISWQPALLAIARGHSIDMGMRGYFAHNSPEGEDVLARYQKGGFTCHVVVGNTFFSAGENLYQNNLYDSWRETNGVRTYDWNSMEKIAATTVAGWMNSPPHRANLLGSQWQSEAIGIYIAANDQILITENFC